MILPKLNRIAFTDNLLDDDCVDLVFDLLMENKNINHVSIGKLISDVGVKIIHSHAPKLDRLVTFDLSSNEGITDSSLPLIIDMIENTKVEISSLSRTLVSAKSSISAPLLKSRILNCAKQSSFYKLGVTDDDVIKMCEHFNTFGFGNIEKLE